MTATLWSARESSRARTGPRAPAQRACTSWKPPRKPLGWTRWRCSSHSPACTAVALPPRGSCARNATELAEPAPEPASGPDAAAEDVEGFVRAVISGARGLAAEAGVSAADIQEAAVRVHVRKA